MLKCLHQNFKDKINIQLNNTMIYIINLVSIKVNLNNKIHIIIIIHRQ